MINIYWISVPIQWLLSNVDDAVLMISRQCLMPTFERDQLQRLFSTTGLWLGKSFKFQDQKNMAAVSMKYIYHMAHRACKYSFFLRICISWICIAFSQAAMVYVNIYNLIYRPQSFVGILMHFKFCPLNHIIVSSSTGSTNM
jgi:hypothetical protein